MTANIRIIFVAFSPAAYPALAILGWGGFAAFFHPALVALTIALFALSGASLFTAGDLSPAQVKKLDIAGLEAAYRQN